MVDDIVDTAGTLTNAALALKKDGANSVLACCTHGVLSGPALDRLENSSLDRLAITDTIPLSKPHDKIVVLSATNIIAQTIDKIYNKESINTMFDNI